MNEAFRCQPAHAGALELSVKLLRWTLPLLQGHPHVSVFVIKPSPDAFAHAAFGQALPGRVQSRAEQQLSQSELP